MVARRNRQTGEAFLGCSRYPSCTGTRPIQTGSPGVGHLSTPARGRRLSLGGRPKGVGDYTELAVARIVGRDLTKREGCLVQAVAILVLVGLSYWFLTSALYVDILKALANWYAHQIKFPGAATPIPGG